MGRVIGLYTHIQHNLRLSRALIASFFAAVCVCWVLCCVSYNVTLRYVFGEPFHNELWNGGKGFTYASGAIRTKCAKNDSRCASIAGNLNAKTQPTMWELAGKGVMTGLTTLYLPLAAAFAWLAFFWFQNERIVGWAMGAFSASRTLETRIYNIVENLSIQVGRPMPRIEIIETPAMNAYASGLSPERSAIGVTRGLIDNLNDRELAAVMAHELTHIINGDNRLMMVATVFVDIFRGLFYFFYSGLTGAHERSTTSALANLPARLTYGVLVFVPLCLSIAVCWLPSLLARASLSRSREFLADAGAAELTRDPDALISALRKVAGCSEVLAVPPTMQAMMIFGQGDLLTTHPSIEDRIAALREYAGAMEPVARASTVLIPERFAVAPARATTTPVFGRRVTPPGLVSTR